MGQSCRREHRASAITGELGRIAHCIQDLEYKRIGVVILVIRENDQREAVVEEDDVLRIEAPDLSSVPPNCCISACTRLSTVLLNDVAWG